MLDRRKRNFEVAKRLAYLKYQIIAILDHLIILKAKVTSYRCADSPVLRSMLKSFKTLTGCVLNVDRVMMENSTSNAITSS